MANNLLYNPLRCDTAATVIDNDDVYVNALQWVDDDGAAGGIIADTENLDMTINGAAVHLTCADISAVSPMPWSVSFPQPMLIRSLVVSAIDGGVLLVWKA